MRARLAHPWLQAGIALVLGGVFIAAALPKLQDPPAFARALWNYRLAPEWLVQPAALVLPWLELICAAALGPRRWRRAAAGWIAALLLVFIGALGINLARRHPVDCGCFGAKAARPAAEQFAEMRLLILRDLALLALAGALLAAARKDPDPA